MAQRKLGGAGQRGYAIPKAGLRRQSAESAERVARIFSRRRNAVRALPSSAPKKPSYSSNEQQSSSNGESSSSETIDDAVYRCGFNTDWDGGPKANYFLVGADVGDENSSCRFKITAEPASEIYLKSLVQDKEPLLNLEQDVTSHLVLKKIKELHEKYASFRRVRGDGNCFFRAFKFAYLEHILLMNDMGEANRILKKVEEFKYRILLDHMAPSETLISDYDAFCNIVTLVSSSSENRISHAVLLQWSKDEDGYSDPAIRFLRMVTSNEICKRPNHFEQSIQGLLFDNAMTVQKFCEIEVEPMDKDVDNVQIIAFVDALGVPIRIEYVQDSEHKLNHYDFGIEASPLEEPYITLLYRPGHYDILYTKEYHVVVPEPVEVVLKDSEIPKEEPRTIAKVPLTSEIDPSEKEEDMRMVLHTFIRRKRKGIDKGV